ncbi:MAG: hypothetical protein JKY53_07855 [Flavobacteriales bacterium]|nr:hypothetical protein [Flavobacteriales bacterium]
MAYTNEQKTGVVGTIAFHAVLLILFLIFGLSHVVPEPLTGIPISFGNSADGGGDTPPQESTAPTDTEIDEQVEEVSETKPVEASTPTEKVLTQQDIEAIRVATAKEKAEKERKEQEAEIARKEAEAKAQADKLASAFSKPQGQGNTQGATDQGNPDGNVGASSGTPGNGGGGVRHSFTNRSLLSTPKIDDDSQDEGKVVVDIVVDRNGNVTKATPGAKGSDTNSSHLFNKAKKAALKTKFSPNPNAPAEQYGKLTFRFVLE